jgi:translation initiation factor 1
MSKEALSKLVTSRNFVVRLKLDTGGRKGKAVTVLDGLPKVELFLKELVKSLKQMCGAGGTYLMDKKEGVVEIQGDHRDRIEAFLKELEIKVKR